MSTQSIKSCSTCAKVFRPKTEGFENLYCKKLVPGQGASLVFAVVSPTAVCDEFASTGFETGSTFRGYRVLSNGGR